MKIITTLFTLGLLVPIISAQLSFFDNRFPPAPATRRTILNNRNNGQQFGNRRSAALQQAPVDKDSPQNQQISQQHEDSLQDIQDVPQDVDNIQDQPIVQQPVPTTRRPTQRQPTLPSRTTNGFPSRVSPQQQPLQQPQQQDFDDTIAQTHLGTDDGADDQLTQHQDSALTDISMEDVSTERVTPGVTFASTEDTTGDDFTPTAPAPQRPVTTTTTTTAGQRKGGPRAPAATRPAVRKPTKGNGQQRPTTTGRRPSAIPRDRQMITQMVDTSDRQTPVDQTTDGLVDGVQIDDGQVDDGQVTSDGGVGEGARDGVRDGVRGGGQQGVEAVRTQSGGGAHGDDGSHDDGGHHDHHSGDPIQWLRDAVRGEPGADYPIFYTPPKTSFKCTDQQFPGYYADVDARCQVFHICQDNGRSDAFLCPNGTIFSQQVFVCVWWHDFDCSMATQYYNLNSQLYTTPDASQQPAQPSQPTVDDDFERPAGGPATRPGGRPTDSGRPGGRRPAPVDAVGGRPGGPSDERIQMPIGDDLGEAQVEEVGGGVDTEAPLGIQTVTDGSQDVTADETPAFDGMITTTQTGLRAPNGRPSGGVKGITNGKGIRRPTNGGPTPVTKKTGQAMAPQPPRTQPITTTRPVSNGQSKKTRPVTSNGQQTSIPSSPADKARNGLTKSVRPQTNGFNGQAVSRPTGMGGTRAGTKSFYRASQQKELDGQQSAPNNWYYHFNL